jgi:UDP-N-acetylmuramoylalanine--D-glutamate ligase
LHLGGFDRALLDGASQVIASPGVSVREPMLAEALTRGLPVVGDIELFAREAGAPIVGITGTNGKSTVTTLVKLMIDACGRRAIAGGNLGRAALDLLEDPLPDFYVLELSSFQLETTYSLPTAAATVLNVTSDHMDRYDTMVEYAQAKARVFDHCAVAVINLDDAAVRRMPRQGQRTVGFSLRGDPGAEFGIRPSNDDVELVRNGERLVAMSELKISGLHNAANALASLALCAALDLDLERCVRALRDFSGLPHRSQWVVEVRGVRYIDDSKGTNVGATLAAVRGLAGPLVIIAGGQGKGQDFAPLADAFRGKVHHAVLIGQDAQQLAAVLRPVCAVEFAGDMQSAVKVASRVAKVGDTVLLSPACASLDMFHDYAHRGDVFAEAARSLAS